MADTFSTTITSVDFNLELLQYVTSKGQSHQKADIIVKGLSTKVSTIIDEIIQYFRSSETTLRHMIAVIKFTFPDPPADWPTSLDRFGSVGSGCLLGVRAVNVQYPRDKQDKFKNEHSSKKFEISIQSDFEEKSQ